MPEKRERKKSLLVKIIIDDVRKIKVNVFARVTSLRTCFRFHTTYTAYTHITHVLSIVSEVDIRTKAYFRFQIFFTSWYV